MPSASAAEFQRVARRLGFVLVRQRGSHSRWKHADGRGVTIPVHPATDIGGQLFWRILADLEITEEDFRSLK